MGKAPVSYIGLGSNLGDRQASIQKALKLLAEAEGVSVPRISELIETPPLGAAAQPEFINAVAEIKTSLSPEDLLRALLDIETSLGRQRQEKWSPRIIDLDLLLFGDEVVNRPGLTVPHPQMHLRSFVLKGICQLEPELSHPVLKEPMSELAGRLNGADYVLNPDLPQLISIAGIIGVGKTTLTRKLSNLLGCKALFEAYDKNPFMPDVYAGNRQLALDSQLYFLTSRITQLNHNTLQQAQIALSDYVFDKELIYAKRLLSPEQLTLYEQIYSPVGTNVSTPVLVIFLTDSVENCLQRIHRRNRPYEQKIRPQFLKALNADYERLFADWRTCPVIRITASKLDYTTDAHIDHLANQIKSYVAV
ncbi:MAG: 2-amino-4-hydroxy-6-hydroxymethyldihydropteridine diphosphokinase [Planctomycetota bacterium]|nr:MAG: 2-amino-4-hydroxy-6-hydroxymethyldihydropteridine diphosphokinase [Planctomycetota bacterium]